MRWARTQLLVFEPVQKVPTTIPLFHGVAPFERSEIYGEMDEWFKSTVY